MKKYAIAVLAMASITTFAQAVPGGSAKIANAVTTLVPAPFSVSIDAQISEDTVLRWQDANDWMQALQQAAKSAGLRLKPDFAQGRIYVIAGAQLKEPRESAAATAGVPASAIASAPAKAVATPVPTATANAIKADPSPTQVVAAVPLAASFTLKPGIRIDEQFSEWATKEGWSLIWTSNKSWMLPGSSTVTYSGPVDTAIENAVKDLYGNGIPVRLEIWEANKVMEVSHAK